MKIRTDRFLGPQAPLLPKEDEDAQQLKRLFYLNAAAATLHLVQAVIVMLLIAFAKNQSVMPPTRTIKKTLYVLMDPNNANPKCDLPKLTNTAGQTGMTLNLGGGLEIASNNFFLFDDAYGIPNAFSVGSIDIRCLICLFFAFSFIFQALDIGFETYTTKNVSPRLLRFVEYSISASIMIMAIALQVTIIEVYTLCFMFILIFATNILGLFAESLVFIVETTELSNIYASPGLPMPPMFWWTIPHALSWTTCLVGYAPLIDAYLTSTGCSDRTPPGFVDVIVFLECSLFTCFGFVQLYSLVMKTRLLLRTNTPSKGELTHESKQITYQADFAYIILSFTAKTLLAWLILAPII